MRRAVTRCARNPTLTLGHRQDDVAATFYIAQLFIADCGDASAVDPVTDLEANHFTRGQTDQSPPLVGLAEDTDQVDAPQADGVFDGRLTRD